MTSGNDLTAGSFSDSFHAMASTLARTGRPASAASKPPSVPRPAPDTSPPSLRAVPMQIQGQLQDLTKLTSSKAIEHAVSRFAQTIGYHPILPRLIPQDPNGARSSPLTYASQQATLALSASLPPQMQHLAIGDMTIWSCRDPISGAEAQGATFVNPSTALRADLVVGVYRLDHDIAEDPISYDALARFTLVCNAISVPRTRALLSTSATVGQLTQRERQTLQASATGATAREVGTMIGISERTVHMHIQQAMVKLCCATKAKAILRATSLGLI